MPSTETYRVGLIVNPIAGIGGRLATHGSDLFGSLEEACRHGGSPVAEQRSARALARLRQAAGPVTLVTAAGQMGANVAMRSGFEPVVVAQTGERTTEEDTKRAVHALIDHGIDLLLFAGGDGTARDVFTVVGKDLPILGIPAGVKMHSGVFAVSPEAAAEAVAVAIGGGCDTHLAEIMDADEAELASGRPSARLFGYALTPDVARLVQLAKGARPRGGEAAIAALGRKLARELDGLIILGPGTTMETVKRAFGFEGSLLGVDAIAGGSTASRDLDARRLEALCSDHPDVCILVGVVGNQGFVFGRGNQQISPTVIRAAGRDNLHIIATPEKLATLPSPDVWADTGDSALDRDLSGYHRIRTGPYECIMMRLSAAFQAPERRRLKSVNGRASFAQKFGWKDIHAPQHDRASMDGQ